MQLHVHHIARKKNPANVLSEHWDLPSVWNAMKPLLGILKLMAPPAGEVEEGSNIEQKDVAELVSKLDAKHNVKTAAQGKGQKNNHSLIEGSDNDAISSVIQSTNGSHVPSSEPRTDVRPEDKDARLNREHKLEQKR